MEGFVPFPAVAPDGENGDAATSRHATAEEKRFFDTCGWSGYAEGGASRKCFRFADSLLKGAFKAAGARDLRRPGVGTKGFAKAHFAGVVCAAIMPRPPSTVQPYGVGWLCGATGPLRAVTRART